ncbi:MAG: NusG domain II-containing protein, partial [Tenericutes bacterium]|nr:NusG domain II-containing protein [Mycoplasmatota bacterium]
KKIDIIVIGIVLLIGIVSLVGFKVVENINRTDNIYAKVVYRNNLILMIDLKSMEYTVYDTEYTNQIVTTRADEGIFYVPGLVTTEMDILYEVDDFARTNNIVGIKLEVEDQKISVLYQESPRDLCQLQPPTNSHLRPIVCLPNELIIDIYTDMNNDEFIPDSELE